MSLSAEMRKILIDLDVPAERRAWRELCPHLPQTATDEEITISMHLRRTAEQTIPPRWRYYSHRWLMDRAIPSQLPDHLKPSAERMYPRKVDAVGVAVRSRFVEVQRAITGAMSGAVADCYANGDRDPFIVKPQMMAARDRERRGLVL